MPTQNVGKDAPVDDRIDLDDAAREIEARREAWRGAGITVGETTWRDEADGWPSALKTSRSTVRNPDSVGVALSKGRQEGSVVLFAAGGPTFSTGTVRRAMSSTRRPAGRTG